MHVTATIIFAAPLLLVAALGFVAARWRKADLNLLHEWGLGGRRFGTMVSWLLALFLYPRAMTAILSTSSGDMVKRNSALAAAYSFILGLIALLGYMAIAAGVGKDPAYASGFAQYGANFAVPALFLSSFPSWFVGVAFAAIAIGALVPAAVMSIACANLFTRNLYKEFIRPDCTEAEEARMAKIMSLVVKIGALVFILVIPQGYAIEFQLLGGIWIIQLLPPIVLGLYTRHFNPIALLAGWVAGTVSGTYMAAAQGFTSSVYPLAIFGVTVPSYAALYSVAINFLVAALLTPPCDLAVRRGAASAAR